MKELIHIHNQGSDLRADSRDIATIFGLAHQHIRETLEKYRPEVEQFGVLQFETGKPHGPDGGRPEKFAYLYFEQIALLLTLSRVTEQNLPMRVKLLLAFRDARNKLRPIDNALLSIPAVWRKTFPDDFYIALLRLYGAEYDPSENKPQWIAGWTVKFIYEPLYAGLSAELKQKRKMHAKEMGISELKKLHQFLEENAKEALKKHLAKVTALLESAVGIEDFYRRFASVFYGQHQPLLKFVSDAPAYEVDRGAFFDTIKKAVQPTEKPPKKTSEPSSDAD